jgi:hypothetical protein
MNRKRDKMLHQKLTKLQNLIKKSKIVVSLLVLTFFISALVVFPVLGCSGHTWAITLDKINGNSSPFTVLTNPIHLDGTISSTNFVGTVSQYQVQISWGDGTVDKDSKIQITQIGSNFIGTWSSNPDHTYSSTGVYKATVKLYHSQPPGAEASGDASYTIIYSVVVGVNIDTSPTGLAVIADGRTFVAPFQANWVVGSQHTISTIEIQQGFLGTRYLWNDWSDGQGISHQVTIQNKDCLYIANFDTQYYLNVTSDPASIPISSGTGWYAESSTVVLNAPMADSFSFNHWVVDGFAMGANVNPISIQMNGPHNAIAEYTSNPQTTPSPTPTSTPSPTPSTEPTTTPSPTISPTPTSTPVPTPTLTPSPTPTPTSTPSPTPTITPSPTPNPTSTPAPISATEPTTTPSPTPSPNTTSIPSPTNTETPTPTTSTTSTSYSNPASTSTTTKTPKIAITFDQSGIENDYTNTILVVDGISYNINNFPVTFQWLEGSIHTFAYNSPLMSNGKRYDWVNTTGLTSLQTGTLTLRSSGTIKANYTGMCYLTVNAIGVTDSFTASVQIVASPLVIHTITPAVSAKQWIAQNHQTTADISTTNIIGHGYWAIFKTWTGRVEQDTQKISFSMTDPSTLNAVFVKVNPVAESILYSLTAGIATMIILSLINKRSPAQKHKNLRIISTATGITAVSLIVAVTVSAVAAIGYGIEVGKLLDFTNWAVIFTTIEAISLMASSIFIVRKIHAKQIALKA